MSSHCNQIRFTGMRLSSSSTTNRAAPGLRNLLGRLSGSWQERRQQIAARQLIESYLALDERMLEDIGLRRSDVCSALELPLSISAAQELEAIKARRLARFRSNPR